jgi:uncharacterized protein (TIGR02466 family)
MTEKKEQPLGILEAFPTYVGIKNWQDEVDIDNINARLKKAIYKKQGQDPDGIYRSNTAGTWHSDDELLKWCEVPELSRMFHNVFSTYATTMGGPKDAKYHMKLQAWGMVYNDRGYATIHNHPNCHFSGVYYVDTGESNERTMVTGVRTFAGDIEFVDGRPTAGVKIADLNLTPAFRLSPDAGQMICFPNWLPHFVHPVVGERDRIAIACNATIIKIQKQENPDDSHE